jgi:hypothetical protein
MMASALCLMSSAVVAQPQTLIRMAGRCCHTVGPHQQVPSRWTAAMRASVCSSVAARTSTWLRSTVRSDRTVIEIGQVTPGPPGRISQQRPDVRIGKRGHSRSLAARSGRNHLASAGQLRTISSLGRKRGEQAVQVVVDDGLRPGG